MSAYCIFGQLPCDECFAYFFDLKVLLALLIISYCIPEKKRIVLLQGSKRPSLEESQSQLPVMQKTVRSDRNDLQRFALSKGLAEKLKEVIADEQEKTVRVVLIRSVVFSITGGS